MSVTNSPKAHEKKQQRDRRLRLQLDNDFRFVMSSPSGRRFFWWLVQTQCDALGKSFTGEANTTAYNEGRRGIGIELIRAAQEVCPPEYATMLSEAMAALAEDVAHRKATEDAAREDEE